MALQASIDRFLWACTNANLSIDMLLERPCKEIIAFVSDHAIPVEDFKEICVLLLQCLDQLEEDSATLPTR